MVYFPVILLAGYLGRCVSDIVRTTKHDIIYITVGLREHAPALITLTHTMRYEARTTALNATPLE